MRSRRSRRIRRRCALADRHRGDERQNRQHAVRRVTGSGQGTPPVQGRHGGVRGLNGPECTSSARRRSQEGGEATPLSRKEGRAKDRKDVVSGKSVTVRVDLGGRRII